MEDNGSYYDFGFFTDDENGNFTPKHPRDAKTVASSSPREPAKLNGAAAAAGAKPPTSRVGSAVPKPSSMTRLFESRPPSALPALHAETQKGGSAAVSPRPVQPRAVPPPGASNQCGGPAAESLPPSRDVPPSFKQSSSEGRPPQKAPSPRTDESLPVLQAVERRPSQTQQPQQDEPPQRRGSNLSSRGGKYKSRPSQGQSLKKHGSGLSRESRRSSGIFSGMGRRRSSLGRGDMGGRKASASRMSPGRQRRRSDVGELSRNEPFSASGLSATEICLPALGFDQDEIDYMQYFFQDNTTDPLAESGIGRDGAAPTDMDGSPGPDMGLRDPKRKDKGDSGVGGGLQRKDDLAPNDWVAFTAFASKIRDRVSRSGANRNTENTMTIVHKRGQSDPELLNAAPHAVPLQSQERRPSVVRHSSHAETKQQQQQQQQRHRGSSLAMSTGRDGDDDAKTVASGPRPVPPPHLTSTDAGKTSKASPPRQRSRPTSAASRERPAPRPVPPPPPGPDAAEDIVSESPDTGVSTTIRPKMPSALAALEKAAQEQRELIATPLNVAPPTSNAPDTSPRRKPKPATATSRPSSASSLPVAKSPRATNTAAADATSTGKRKPSATSVRSQGGAAASSKPPQSPSANESPRPSPAGPKSVPPPYAVPAGSAGATSPSNKPISRPVSRQPLSPNGKRPKQTPEVKPLDLGNSQRSQQDPSASPLPQAPDGGYPYAAKNHPKNRRGSATAVGSAATDPAGNVVNNNAATTTDAITQQQLLIMQMMVNAYQKKLQENQQRTRGYIDVKRTVPPPEPQPDIFNGRRLTKEDHRPADFRALFGRDDLREAITVDSPRWDILDEMDRQPRTGKDAQRRPFH